MSKRVIWKYKIGDKIAAVNIVDLPVGAKIISVGEQRVSPASVAHYIWCEVDPDETTTTAVMLHMFGTGTKFSGDAGLTFIGTIHAADGHVWHYYKD